MKAPGWIFPRLRNPQEWWVLGAPAGSWTHWQMDETPQHEVPVREHPVLTSPRDISRGGVTLSWEVTTPQIPLDSASRTHPPPPAPSQGTCRHPG